VPRYARSPRRKNASKQSARKKLAWATYFAIILVFIACLIWLRPILLPFIIALLVGYILAPLVGRLHGFGLARWLGVIVVYAALVGLAALFLRFLVPIINNESSKLFEKFNVVLKEAPKIYEKLEGGVGKYLDRISGREPSKEV